MDVKGDPDDHDDHERWAFLNLEIRKKQIVKKSVNKGVSVMVCLKTWGAFSQITSTCWENLERLNLYCQPLKNSRAVQMGGYHWRRKLSRHLISQTTTHSFIN